MKKKKVVDIRFAIKRDGYREVIAEIEKKGKCPFCPDNFKYHKHPVLKKQGDWFITQISWPYKNNNFHFIIISKRHKEKISELLSNDMKNILSLAQWVAKKYKIKGGAIAMRFGKTDYTGATVCHLHAHLIAPKLGKTVNFPIG
ncbi:MAG: HIT domain-containing protein [Candidatus Terrybacteria bacterium]|nr:HIT domain-containing protein [Candidatus Terrybacteria bacterium]